MANHSSDTLIGAVQEGDVDKASALIATFGLSYDKAWSDGYVLLCDALRKKHTKIAKILLEHDSAVNIKAKRQTDTPLHFAIKNNDVEMVVMLLDRKANVDAKNHLRETPLHLSIKESNLEIISLLLNKKANVDSKNHLGETPLYLSIEESNLKIVSLLLNENQKPLPVKF